MHSFGRSNPMKHLLRAGAMALALALTGCVGDRDLSVSSEPVHYGATSGGLPVTIQNNSSQLVYVLVTGDPTQPFVVSPTTTTIAAGSSATIQVTSISTGRIYLSYGAAINGTAPDGANSGDTNYHTRFDKLEFTYSAGAGKANLTAVDFYAIPLMLQTSIEGTVIQQLTLAQGKTGSGLQSAITNLIPAASQSLAVVNTTTGGVARVLSPVKRPAAYGRFDPFLVWLENAATFTIAGTFYGTPSQAYNYTGTFGDKEITLGNGSHTIKVSRASLSYNATDLIDHNGIYTCDAPFTVDGAAWQVSANDIYAAVYRDLVAGFNLGFVQPGANTSSAWWSSPAFPSGTFNGTYYNAYAQVIANDYTGAYGFPFADRYLQLQADLGGRIDALTVTVLGDDTPAPGYTPTGNVNPQSGTAQFNMVMQSADTNFAQTTFTFDLQSFQGGNVYTFPGTTPTATSSPVTAVINTIPAQDGLNVYTLQLGGKQYSVLAKVSGGAIAWASIAGGPSATWTAPNLFVGLN